MTLIKCKECGNEISKEADSCPHCGAKRKKTHPITMLIAIFFFFWAFGQLVAGPPSSQQPTKSPVSKPESSSSNQKDLTPLQGNWLKHYDDSDMNDSKSVYVETEANNTIDYWLGHSRPSLIIRCQENKTDIVFVTNTSANPELGNYGQFSVRVRLDDKKPESYKWTESTDNKALFASKPIDLAKKISKAKLLRIEFTPFNASPQIAEFNVAGGAEFISEVAKSCGWKL